VVLKLAAPAVAMMACNFFLQSDRHDLGGAPDRARGARGGVDGWIYVWVALSLGELVEIGPYGRRRRRLAKEPRAGGARRGGGGVLPLAAGALVSVAASR